MPAITTTDPESRFAGGVGNFATGVLNFTRLVQQFRRDRADLRIFQRLDQVLDPIRLVGLDVIVQKNQPITRRGLRAGIALVRKVKRLVVGDDPDRRALGFEKLQRLGELAVRDQDDLEHRK